MSYSIITPLSVEELLRNIEDNKDNNLKFGAGFTDLTLELKKQMQDDIVVINLTGITDESFKSFQKTANGYRLGAMLTATNIVENDEISREFPALAKAAGLLASTQIREVATIGGNVCTASPSGDVACALLALEAECELLATDGSVRVVSLRSFFTGLRKTDRKNNEVLRSFLIQATKADRIISDFIKVGVRKAMECSVISLAYHIGADAKGFVTKAGISIGAVAPTLIFPEDACNFLVGRNIDSLPDADSTEFAEKIMKYASPITDVRGSAWYRKEALYNISKTLFDK